MNSIQRDTKKAFMKLGTCSHTYFHVLNREFDNVKESHERAADLLAGGIMKEGEQCGMLWGATLAVGTEAYNKCKKPDNAIELAITATQHLMRSFLDRTKSINCREITDTNLKNKFGLLKLVLFKARSCIRLAGKWAPEAIEVAQQSLRNKNCNNKSLSCASEVVKMMEGSEEECTMVAGFAGGMGLSGNGCGALSAAIWMASLKWNRENPGKSNDSNPYATNKLIAFYDETNCEILCHKITGRQFNSVEEHTEFIKNGGCEKLINELATA